MQKRLFGSFVLASAGISPLTAATDDGSARLPETLVTATRSETATNELATAATVFTRSDIEQLQAKTLPELLKTAPGIDVTESGGYGKETSIFMRGTNSDHILVLIDGIKAGSVTTGTSAFQFIPIDQVERVEIIRGPHSSLYGSEAIGGVIQIFTRKGAQTPGPSVNFDAGGGSFDTFNTAGTVSGSWQNTAYSLGVSHFNSQGINARDGLDQDRDGYYNTGLNARVSHRFANNAELEAFFLRAEGRTDYDGYANKNLFVNQTAGTAASFDLLDNWRSILRFGQSLDEGDNFFADGAFYSRFNSRRWNASWVNQIDLHQHHKLTLGSDYRVDEVQSTTRYNETSRYDIGVFGQLHSRIFDHHFLNASLRWDENQAFGDRVTGNFGWRFNWRHGLSAFASFGNAFKAPTFNDLYWPRDASTYFGTTYVTQGSSSLEPEESTSFEAGVAGSHSRLNWQLRAYHTNIDNLIDWGRSDINATTIQYMPANVNKAQIDGLEAELSSRILGWEHKLNMALLSPRDRVTNLDLARRAEQTLSYDVSRAFGAFDIGAHVLAQGKRFDDRANRIEVDGFVTVDLRTAYRIDKHWLLSAKLNNLLDKDYQTVATYNNFGRNFFFTVHFNH